MQIIAELGSNWYTEHNIHTAIDEAEAAGCSWFKIQYLRADTLYSQTRAPKIHEKIKQYEIKSFWIPAIAEHVHEKGMEFCASVFDANDASFLVDHVDALKLASGDLTNLFLMRGVAVLCTLANKMFMFSTGAGTQAECLTALATIRQHYPHKPIMFQCVSAYPSLPIHYNLRSMLQFKDRAILGVSDHTMGNEVAMLATALGYEWVEKHFRGSSQHDDTPDYPHSLDCCAMTDYVTGINVTETILGDANKHYWSCEESERVWARRGSDGLRPVDNVSENSEPYYVFNRDEWKGVDLGPIGSTKYECSSFSLDNSGLKPTNEVKK